MKHIKVCLIILIFSPMIAVAGSFTSSISNTDVQKGRSITLTLTLSDDNAVAPPNIHNIDKDFKVISQQTYSSVQIIQWKKSTTTTWQYTLMPKKLGELQIPSLEVKTDSGLLRSEPINVNVTNEPQKAIPGNHIAPIDLGIKLLDKTGIYYESQPIIFELYIKELQPTTNLRLEQNQNEGYVIEQISQPKSMIEIDDRGMQLETTIIKYILTPFTQGSISLPTYSVTGYEHSNVPNRRDNFGFGITSVFDNLSPFETQTDSLEIKVQPKVANVNPWLPAEDISIKESWSNIDNISQGEPITRTITITGTGTLDSNLPLEPLMVDTDSYKAYADQSTSDKKFITNNIVASTTHTYTIIPTKSGNIEFPEININWWNTKEHKAQVSSLTPKKIFAKATAPSTNKITEITSNVAPDSQIVSERKSNMNLTNILLACVLACLIILIALVLRKKKTTNNDDSVVIKQKSKNLEIDNIKSVEQLSRFLDKYLSEQFNIPENTAISLASKLLKDKYNTINSNALEKLAKRLDANKYNNQFEDIEELKSLTREVLVDLINKASQDDTEKTINSLNPN